MNFSTEESLIQGWREGVALAAHSFSSGKPLDRDILNTWLCHLAAQKGDLNSVSFCRLKGLVSGFENIRETVAKNRFTVSVSPEVQGLNPFSQKHLAEGWREGVALAADSFTSGKPLAIDLVNAWISHFAAQNGEASYVSFARVKGVMSAFEYFRQGLAENKIHVNLTIGDPK